MSPLCRIYVALRALQSVHLESAGHCLSYRTSSIPAKRKRDFASLESDRLLYVIEIQRLFASLEKQGRQGYG